jgi:hypothetical protein
MYFPRYVNAIVTKRQTQHFDKESKKLHVSAARNSRHQSSRFRNIKKEIT